ncbi:RepB family plasmid replication initiator protein [Salmonella enterica]|nr:RepB family plasmid replication initiator protein [Salmonella enterica]ECU8425309.1 RepB family plasmid replication initiator protein [Salmonella enterica subsp. enterica serovar Javiana]EDV1758772.1 RepB family plasmid replication initiator protein [Salmonella enterica subsp. enterica]EDY0542895.1 RepB family plasmid replication initiator protein [Salmonella enterica subsp. enterica serovar Panama]EAO8299764.1 RepB family plasmid replication initiator protein [Salmonella enterica]
MFEEVDKSSGEVVNLTPNASNTVQPVALMRLGVFVPTLKSLKNSKKNTLSRTDATEELTRLSLARAEGFDKVEITGPRLDMDNDFKTWVGVIHSFARHKVIGDKVELPFVEFAKLCGIPSSQSSRKLRERISPSLKRIAGTVISFSRTTENHTKEYITHLVQSAYYDTEKDIVQLQADPRLFELYQFDRKVLLQLKAINALKRRESAQALYTFIESLPRDPAPISLARLRARLNLKSPVFSQNQTVRRAMEQLREIGYLDYTEIQRGRTKLFCIHYRRPKLKPPHDESAENPQLPATPAGDVSPEMTEKLALLEKLGITLDDLEKLFKFR